jgi:hypothetical protein
LICAPADNGKVAKMNICTNLEAYGDGALKRHLTILIDDI